MAALQDSENKFFETYVQKNLALNDLKQAFYDQMVDTSNLESAATYAEQAAASAASAAAVVTGGTATLTPEAGKIPLADGTGKIDNGWLPASPTFSGDVRITGVGNLLVGTTETGLTGKVRVVNTVRVADATTESNALLTTVSATTATIETRYATPLIFGTGATERARITSGGDLLIGQTTTKTSEYVRFSGAGQASLLFDNSGKNNGAFVGTFNDAALVGVNRNPSTGFFYDAGKHAADIVMVGSATESYLLFETTSAVNTIPVERVRINSTGLSVTGNVTASTYTKTGSYTVATVPSASASGAGACIYVTDSSGGSNAYFSDGTTWRNAARTALA